MTIKPLFLHMPALRWSLVPHLDAVNGNLFENGLSNGFRNASSAQMVYFHEGSISEFIRLCDAFNILGKPYPSVSDVQSLITDIEPLFKLRNYTFQHKGDTWWLSNTSASMCTNPFQGKHFDLFIELGNRTLQYNIPADSYPLLFSLFEHLSGSYEIDFFLDAGKDQRYQNWVANFIADGVVQMIEEPAFDFDDLPDLTFLGHSSLALKGRETLLVIDPVYLPTNSASDHENRTVLSIIKAADVIVISHHHWDHLHFQTLVRLPKDKLFVVPQQVQTPSFSNPPIADYLRSLGFYNIIEAVIGEIYELGDMILRPLPFYGEPFGIDSVFDAFTYHITFAGLTLYGSVDACFNELEDMDATIKQVAALGELDFFLFGSSNQTHTNPWKAAGPKHFSNELSTYPDMLRYHPNINDAQRWAGWLKPRVLLPYAQFVFKSSYQADLNLSDIVNQRLEDEELGVSAMVDSVHFEWLAQLKTMRDSMGLSLVRLRTLQGVWFDDS